MYLGVATIQGSCLFEGSIFSRKYGMYLLCCLILYCRTVDYELMTKLGYSAESLLGVFPKEETEAVLLVEADNAFNGLNR